MTATPLRWERLEPGKYVAVASDGTRYLATQWNTRRWHVYRNGKEFATWPHTLHDAKWAAEEDADPAARARRQVRDEKRARMREQRS